MRTSHAARLALCAIATICAAPAASFAVLEKPLSVRLEHADVVVVATAISAKEGSDGFVRATLRVESVLKGRPGLTVSFIPKGAAVEFGADCCVVGARYLLFLSRPKNGDTTEEYESTNGQFGVYRLDRAEEGAN